MLIQRNGVTTHRILSSDARFSDFHNLVCFENFGKKHIPDKTLGTVHIPATDTTYTLLKIPEIVSAVTSFA